MPTPDPRRRLALATGAALALAGPTRAQSSLPRVSVGTLERLPALPSRHLAPRWVDVWLPPGYDGSRPHAVLYLHDGQMLFDARTTWNGQSWDVAPTAARLIGAGLVRDFIVVGVWNGGERRFAEYFPAGFLPHVPPGVARETLLSRGLRGAPGSDAYLRFLVEDLKPAIDARYATERGPQATCILGSSMGGLVSIYALCEYPQVFGGAACLSTHWIGGHERNDVVPAAARAYLRERLPAPGKHRIYMDRGTTELDELYDLAQQSIDALMASKGFAPPLFDTRVFHGAGHNEKAWAARLEVPLVHLFGK